MVYVTACQIGVLALDEEMELVDWELFPGDAETVRERLHVLDKGQMVPELEKLVSGIEGDIVTELDVEGLDAQVDADHPAVSHVQENLRELAAETGFVEEPAQLNRLLGEMSRLETKEELRRSEKRDKLVSQAVASIDDLTEITNEMSERLREWYGMYHPELEEEVSGNEEYARRVVEGTEKPDDSVGIDVSPGDMEPIMEHARCTSRLFDLRNSLESYLEESMEEVAPNMSSIAGPVLAARLINHAGSLEKLAKMPASTIQMLGAEKAFFRFMEDKKKGRDAKPPKHGMIFTHPLIQKTDEGKRGKVARALASKLSMAAKTDFYSDEDRSERYERELEERMEEIRREG